MRLLKLIIFLWCIQMLLVSNTMAQQVSWEEFVEEISGDEYEENGEINALISDLEEIHEHPFNLNTATKEQLEQLHFLNNTEIEELLAYIYIKGPMKTLGELILIEKLNYKSRQYLLLFTYVENIEPEKEKEKIKWKDLWKKGKHEIMTRLDIPLYEREGYKSQDTETLIDNPNKIYLGSKLYNNIRYNYSYNNKLYFGLTAEKDAGEPFGGYGNKGYDSYSYYFLLKDIGHIKTLALGDYRLSFGEGLVVNCDFSFGKSTMLNMSNTKPTIKKFSSTSETNFFQGAAITLNFNHLDITAFYSYLPTDATLNDDETISSLYTDGLHRTLLETTKKHNVIEQSVGGDLTWNDKHFSLGLTALYQHFDHTFNKGTAEYRQYYPEGNDFTNVSLHYSLFYYKFLFSGETAYSNVYDGWATTNKAIYHINKKISIIALQRFFAYQYVGLRANSFSEGGYVRNESGYYLGTEVKPLDELKLSFYADYFHFPWPKYATPHSSDGVDISLQSDWKASDKWNLTGRYQIKRKERYGDPYLYHKIKLNAQFTPTNSWELRLNGRFTRVRDEQGGHVKGYMLGEILKWKTKKETFNLSLSCFYFDSEDYKAPMSFYEPSVLHTFSFMTMYGNGLRSALNARLNITKNWMVMLKFGSTHYFDRDVIGDDLEQINSNWKNDLTFLIRYKI